MTKFGLREKVILTLADPFLDKAYHLYFDNFFSSVQIAEELLKRNTYCCGTVRPNRKKWPKDQLNPSTSNKVLKRGEHRSVSVSSGQVEYQVWKDDKVVSLINTVTEPTQLMTVNRQNKDGTRKQITCPQSVKEYNKNMGGVDLADARRKMYSYNKNMGGVDLADARRKMYSCSRRSKKWCHRLFYFLVNMSMVNVYLLHQKQHPQSRSFEAINPTVYFDPTL